LSANQESVGSVSVRKWCISCVSTVHQGEDSPAEVLALVAHVTGRFGGEFDGLGGHVAGGIAVHELDPIGDLELDGPGTRLGDERRTDIDPGPADAVVAGPGAQQFARSAGQIEDTGIGCEVEGATEDGELLRAERVVDPVAAFADDEGARQVDDGKRLA
jgi:hypothetical protein